MIDYLNAFVLLGNFVILPSIVYGAQLALGALGITLVYGVLRFANFAHGDTMAWGTMCVIIITWTMQSMGMHLGMLPTALLAILPAIIITALVVVATDRMVYRHYRRIKDPTIRMVMASVGVMFIMNGIVRFIIGPDDRQFADGEKFIIRGRTFREMTGLNEGLSIKISQVITIAVAVALGVALFYFLKKTKVGKSMRAFADNEELALLCGIKPQRIVDITWILAAALATIAGTLYGLDKSFKPFTYFQLLLPMFAAAIVGGIGKPAGAIIGGFVIAFSELAITYAYRKFAIYIMPQEWQPSGLMQILSTDYKFAVSFTILVIVLLIRPQGILKGKVI